MRHFLVGVLSREEDMIEFGKWLGRSLRFYVFIGPEPKAALIFLVAILGQEKLQFVEAFFRLLVMMVLLKVPLTHWWNHMTKDF